MTPRCLLLVLALAASPALAQPADAGSPASAPAPVASHLDPWEGFNRKVYRFNDTLDRYLVKPVAKGYQRAVPRPLRFGLTNFFRNLKMPVVMLNDLLQGKPRAAGQDVSRFVVNTTLGIAGFFDAATKLELPRNDEDFGQTLGVWGVRNGPYLVLPFLGPSTVRDGVGFGVDVVTDPITYALEEGGTAGLWAVKLVNTRANLLEVEQIIQGDRYLFLRDLYLQSREFAVKDGVVESDPFLDEESYEETESDGDGAVGGTTEAEAQADTEAEAGADTDAAADAGAAGEEGEAAAPAAGSALQPLKGGETPVTDSAAPGGE